MKPVSASITSSKPISLSKAARALSKFISVENGASQAVAAYLNRAASSFNELVQFHENLESGELERSKHKKSRFQTAEIVNGTLTDEGEKIRRVEEPPSAVSRGEDGSRNLYEERGDFDGGGRKSEKKKKSKRRELLEDGGGDGAEEGDAEEKRSEKKKKRKKIEIEDGLDDSNEKVSNSKKKRKKIEIEDGLDDSNEKVSNSKKKRKKIEIEDGLDDSNEKVSNSKKKRRKRIKEEEEEEE